MSETMSSPSTDWAQFYQHHHSGQPQTKPASLFISDRVSDPTAHTTTTITPTSRHLSPEGRVSKPIRKRSRASRRTPTTLLNTDTTNFRAMVQQYTGGPSVPFASGSTTGPYTNGTNFNFGLATGQQIMNPNTVMVPRGGYNIVQVQHQQQQQFQQQQHQQYMLSLNNTSSHGDHAFLQRLQNTNL